VRPAPPSDIAAPGLLPTADAIVPIVSTAPHPLNRMDRASRNSRARTSRSFADSAAPLPDGAGRLCHSASQGGLPPPDSGQSHSANRRSSALSRELAQPEDFRDRGSFLVERSQRRSEQV